MSRLEPNLLPVLALALLLGCGGRGCGADDEPPAVDPDEEGAVYEHPPSASPGTLRGLGPHLWEASFDRRGDRRGIWSSRSTSYRLVWADLGWYEYQEFGPDTLRFEEIQAAGSLYRRDSSPGTYRRSDAIEGNSIILQRSVQAWSDAIGPYAELAAWERKEDRIVEGRPARVYRLSLAPMRSPGEVQVATRNQVESLTGLAITPLSLTGVVYVDIETGSRLLAELEGRFIPRQGARPGDPTDEVLITYRETRSPTQLAPVVVAPPAAQVREVRTPPRALLGVPGTRPPLTPPRGDD